MEEGFFEGRGPRIHWQAHPVDGADAAVAIVHGYGEHAGRYLELVRVLEQAGLSCFLLDLRGHGLSEGARGFAARFEDYLADLGRLVERARSSSDRVFLLGHSLGGLVVLRYLLEDPAFEGAIVSAPYLRLAFAPPSWKLALAGVLRRLAPRLPIPSGLRYEMLTRDAERLAQVKADSLYFTTTTAGWYFEALRAQEEVRARAAEIRLPILGLLPTADPVVDPRATQEFFERIGSEDRRLVRFEGARHEVFNEIPEVREPAIAAVRDWILERAGRGAVRAGAPR
jgi:alpha-beta hydrolase superfamily lysophospholipase